MLHEQNIVEEKLQPFSLLQLVGYFLWLGTFGFGGPVALLGYMQRDLVEKKKWFSKIDYLQGLALSQLSPGPFASQVAMYLGWIKSASWGATAVAIAFILPSFLIVLLLSVLYIHYGKMSWMEGAFYGVGAVVISIILHSVIKLTRMVVQTDVLLWLVFIANTILFAVTSLPVVWGLLVSGLLVMTVKQITMKDTTASLLMLTTPKWLFTGLHGAASSNLLLKIFFYFAWSGLFVFGSGLAIVPFLHNGVVDKYHWLTNKQFLDAVAVALITPGPSVITVAFIGYLVAGLSGAIIAAVGVFLPCYLFIILLAPYYRRVAGNRYLEKFIVGVTTAALGAITGSAFILGKHAIMDIPTLLIFLLSFMILLTSKRIPDFFLILLAGIIGVLLKTITFA